MESNKIILGLDPGTNIMGYGLIQSSKKSIKLIQYGVLNLKKQNDHIKKLQLIFESVNELIKEYKPNEISIESPFFGKNVQSMLKLGRAQGVAMAAGLVKEIPITEYSPKKIKMAITGNGNASKEQVAKMLQSISKFDEIPKNLDSTDGLAAAMCHFFNSKKITSIGTKFSGWQSYIKNNPEKIS